MRELIGGVYFGNHETHTLENGEKQAVDTMPYAEHEIERIGRIGFETARKRRKKLCCVDKANVLDTSRLWRSVMHRLQGEYPDVETICNKLVRVVDTVEPEPELVAKYEEKYRKFRKLYPAMKELFR